MPFGIVTCLHFWCFVVLEQNVCFSLKMVPGVRGSGVLDAYNYSRSLNHEHRESAMYLSDIVVYCQKSPPKNLRNLDFEGNISCRFSIGQGKEKDIYIATFENLAKLRYLVAILTRQDYSLTN